MEALSRIRLTYETEGRRLARWGAGLLRALPISPNAVTVTGTLLNAGAAMLVYDRRFVAAMIVFVLGSLMDAMDGAFATVRGKTSAFGAFLDSTLDRVGEGFMLMALGLMFAADDKPLPLAACFVALAGSYLVSYTRARAEALGVQCKVGIASRVERVVVLSAGLLATTVYAQALEITVYALAATAAITVVQRIVHVWRCLKRADAPGVQQP